MGFEMFERYPQESNREYVYRLVKMNIMNLKIAPGSTLSEKDIASTLGVSRTPVREAFIQLSREYLLDVLPQKGTYVSLIDLQNVEESKFLRENIEYAVVEIVCTTFPSEMLFELQSNIALQELCLREKKFIKFYELDEDLHRIIYAGAQKARTWIMLQQMHAHYNRVRRLNIAGGYDLPRVLEQHQALVTAICDQNVELGKQTIELHLNKVNLDIKDLLQDYGHYFKQP